LERPPRCGPVATVLDACSLDQLGRESMERCPPQSANEQLAQPVESGEKSVAIKSLDQKSNDSSLNF